MTFGRFPLDTTCTLQPLSWGVLDVVNGCALLLSTLALILWSERDSNAPLWEVWRGSPAILEEGFREVASLRHPQDSQVPLKDQRAFESLPGASAKVFVLSEGQVRYYLNPKKRVGKLMCAAKPTAYALAQLEHASGPLSQPVDWLVRTNTEGSAYSNDGGVRQRWWDIYYGAPPVYCVRLFAIASRKWARIHGTDATYISL